MAYDQDQIIEQALEVIEKEDCVTVDEVCLYLPLRRETLYSWDPNKLNTIKAAIEQKRIQIKKKMRRNWRNSDNATLQIAEFKLMATDEELEAITISKVNQAIKVDSIPTIQYQILTDESKEVTSE